LDYYIFAAVLGTAEQEWSRLQDYINTVQVSCRQLSNVFSSTVAPSIDDLLFVSCSEYHPVTPASSCLTAVFRYSTNIRFMIRLGQVTLNNASDYRADGLISDQTI